MIFFKCFIKYFIHHSLSADTSLKFLAIILLEIRRFTKFHPFVCQRAVILQGEIIQRKPKICVSYLSMRNPYMKFQDDISNLHSYIHTDKLKQYVPHFFKVGGIKNEYLCKLQFYYMKVGCTLHGHVGMLRCNMYRGGGHYVVYVEETKRYLSDCAVALANLCHCYLTYDRFTQDLPHFSLFLIGSNFVVFHFHYALWASDLCKPCLSNKNGNTHMC